jgi:hypothetical protein
LHGKKVWSLKVERQTIKLKSANIEMHPCATPDGCILLSGSESSSAVSQTTTFLQWTNVITSTITFQQTNLPLSMKTNIQFAATGVGRDGIGHCLRFGGGGRGMTAETQDSAQFRRKPLDSGGNRCPLPKITGA